MELTRQEFDLLHLLASRPGIVFSRAALLQSVWSDDTYVTERTVDTVVSRLRRKIERDPHDPELILTAWGVGYKFADARLSAGPGRRRRCWLRQDIVNAVRPGRLSTSIVPP